MSDTEAHAAYRDHFWRRWFWEHGGEEPVGPLATSASSQSGPFPHPWKPAIRGPLPDPWRVAVGQLVQAAVARDLAEKLPEGRLRSELGRSSGATIESILDDWCGTPPRRYPWPWPGPPPWVWEIASELTLVANSLQPGSLRDAIGQVAVQALQKAAEAQS